MNSQAELNQTAGDNQTRKHMAGKIAIKFLLLLSLALCSLCKMSTTFLRQKETRNGKSKWIGCGYGLFSFPNRGVLYNGILFKYQFYS